MVLSNSTPAEFVTLDKVSELHGIIGMNEDCKEREFTFKAMFSVLAS